MERLGRRKRRRGALTDVEVGGGGGGGEGGSSVPLLPPIPPMQGRKGARDGIGVRK